VYAVIDSGLIARKLKTYQLKEYNRWYLYVLLIVIAAGYPVNMAHSIRMHVLQAFKISSASMSPSFLPGDYVLLNKAVYKTRAPRRGDAVIFIYPDDRRLDYVKRLVALPGDTVEIRENILLVNGQALDGPAAEASNPNFQPGKTQAILMEQNDGASYPIIVAADAPQNMARLTVPHGCCFVLGDNRCHSVDSRNFGPVQMSDILGRLDYIYWPSGSWSRLGPYPRK
jgi:signal peptidase I